MKIGIKPMKADENILYAIFYQLAVVGNLGAVSIKRIYKFRIYFAEGSLIT